MDEGRIIEYDTPNNLLADTSTVFYCMAHNTGLVGSYGNQGKLEAAEHISPHVNDREMFIEETGKETGTEDSSNGRCSMNGQSGHEASDELSNGSSKKCYIESSSIDSVRFGDVSIVTPQQIPHYTVTPPQHESIVTPQRILPYSETPPQQSLYNIMKGDNCVSDIDSLESGPPLDLSGSESKNGSDRSEYYTADSQAEDTVLQSPVDGSLQGSSGEETLLASDCDLPTA